MDISKDYGVEYDFYMGYVGVFSLDLSYCLYIVIYLYNDGGLVYSEDCIECWSIIGVEFVNSLSYKDFDVGVMVVLVDVSYVNVGDIYLSFVYYYVFL